MWTPAVACPPSPADSSIPCGILFVGTNGGNADQLGAFEIVIRDFARNPIAGSNVVIEFEDCVRSGDLRVASTQPDPSAAMCGGTSVALQAYTGHLAGSYGILHTSLVGGGRGKTPSTANVTPDCQMRQGGCASIYADGVHVGSIPIARLDADGVNGLGPPDISYWLSDAFGSGYLSRSDFDFNGELRAPDLAILLQAIMAGGSLASATSYCE